MTIILSTKRNSVGTVSFDAKFKNMRKSQDFIVYPMKAGETTVMVQSDTRIGTIDLTTGAVRMAGPHAGGAYGVHLAFAKQLEPLPAEDLFKLKAAIQATAGKHVTGTGMVYVNNEGAADALSI